MSGGRRAVVLLCAIVVAISGYAAPHRFAIDHDHFALDGKPFQIISGEMHYARIPSAYWRARLRMARAMGLNTVSTYVFWNLHEPIRGHFDFTGQNDVAEFVREAQQEGLYVILRPGPYICSEWDLGGLPAWLLADPSIVLRSRDPKFLEPAREYLKRVGEQLAPLQASRGGPIIAVQVENEYGSFDQDQEYMADIRDEIRAAGFIDVLLYTADGPQQLLKGTLPDLPAAVNFGPGEAQAAFDALKKFRPGSPLMAGEYWAGWFDQWGRPHNHTNAAEQERDLDRMLSQGYSVNLYMFHGGTTFGFMNGANLDKSYLPQTSSYDYDAALDESGRPTPKYFAFRKIILKHRPGAEIPAVPRLPATITIPKIELAHTASLWSNLPQPVASGQPIPMEMLGQTYGYILYRAQVVGRRQGELRLNELHDYAEIFVNGKEIGTLDRRLRQNHLNINFPKKENTLDLLIENTGRINFTKVLRSERKGITQSVTLDGKELRGWKIFSLPMRNPERLHFSVQPISGPAFYRAEFKLKHPGDTFLDTRQLHKGIAWINGHALGRFWSIGPQQTLYVPAPWLRTGKNVIVFFDLNSQPGRFVQGLTAPILNDM